MVCRVTHPYKYVGSTRGSKCSKQLGAKHTPYELWHGFTHYSPTYKMGKRVSIFSWTKHLSGKPKRAERSCWAFSIRPEIPTDPFVGSKKQNQGCNGYPVGASQVDAQGTQGHAAWCALASGTCRAVGAPTEKLLFSFLQAFLSFSSFFPVFGEVLNFPWFFLGFHYFLPFLFSRVKHTLWKKHNRASRNWKA